MSEKFLKLEKEGQPIQRLFGPRAREVFATEWQPFGWTIVGEPVAIPEPEPVEKPKAKPAGKAGK